MAAPLGAKVPRNVVTDEPLKEPRMPAGSWLFPPGLAPLIDAKSPSYVLAEQNRPGAFRQTRTERRYVSKAQLFPRTPVSTSLTTRYDTLSTNFPWPQPRFGWPGDATARARTKGTRSPPTWK
jgi:hypothetical protein